jgi:hypothetical protein
MDSFHHTFFEIAFSVMAILAVVGYLIVCLLVFFGIKGFIFEVIVPWWKEKHK